MIDLKYNIIFNRLSLEKLLTNPKLCKVYQVLLHGSWDEEFTNYVEINLEQFKKRCGYKTRSGLWKALKHLEQLELIEYYSEGWVILRGTYFKII